MSEVKNEENYSILELLNKYYSPKKHGANDTLRAEQNRTTSKHYALLDDVTENYVLGYN